MKLFEWFVLIVVLILVFAFIFFGRRVVNKNYSYGTWTTTTGRCANQGDNCALPGTQFVNQYCEPDPVTRRGCLDANDRQTYAPIITTQSCTLQCRQSVWDIEVGPCLAVDGGGQQDVTYTCVPHDDTGINACTTAGLVDLNGGKYQGVTPYPVGTVLNFELGCIPPASTTTQKLGTSDVYTPRPSWDDTYIYTPDCVVQDGEGGDLKEGYLKADGVALNAGSVPLPPSNSPPSVSGDSTSVPPSGTAPPPPSPLSIMNGTYQPQPDGVNTLTPCRRWSGQRLAFVIRTPHGVIAPIQTPNTVPTLGVFTNWNRPMDQKLLDVPLTWLGATSLSGCSRTDLEYNSGLIFLLGIRKQVGNNRYLCNIGILISDHYWGWLGVVDGIACWIQAQSRYRGPGITSLYAPYFMVEVNGPEIKILTPEAGKVNLASVGYILGKSNQTIPLEGQIIYLDPELSLSGRADNSLQTCNYLLRNKVDR